MDKFAKITSDHDSDYQPETNFNEFGVLNCPEYNRVRSIV